MSLQPILLDSTGQRIATALETMANLSIKEIDSYYKLQRVLKDTSVTEAQLLGVEIPDTWANTSGTSYDNPMVVMAVRTVTDSASATHRAAICQRKWACSETVQFDAPEQVEATEETAQADTYYYGLTGSTVSAENITALNLSTGDTIPYSSYTKVFKNSVNDSTKNIFQYGYNNYELSAVRQWLNSSAAANAWWSAAHVGDSAPNNVAKRGYMAGCSNELLAAVKPIQIKVAKNYITDGGTSSVPAVSELYDKFWLPTAGEVYGVGNSVSAYEDPYDPAYFQQWKELCGTTTPTPNYTANAGRISYSEANHTSAQYCWLRSASRSNSYGEWLVYTTGDVGAGTSYSTSSVRPACAIY